MQSKQAPAAVEKHKKPLHRSPAYPFITLKKAIARATTLQEKEGRHAARFSVVVGHWEYKPKSSGALQTVAALRQFGLILPGTGTGEDRLYQLTDLALRIILDKREEEKRKAIAQAAITPKLYADLWRKWGRDLPSDDNIESHLTLDLGFNPSTSSSVIKDYRETLAFAGLLDSDTLPGGEEEEKTPPEEESEEMNADPPHEKPASQRNPLPGNTNKEQEILKVMLAGGRTARVLVEGPALTQTEMGKLISYLGMIKDDFPTGSDHAASPAPSEQKK